MALVGDRCLTSRGLKTCTARPDFLTWQHDRLIAQQPENLHPTHRLQRKRQCPKCVRDVISCAVCWLVHHFGPLWNISISIVWINLKFCADIPDSVMICYTDFGGAPNFSFRAMRSKFLFVQYSCLWPTYKTVGSPISLSYTLCLVLIVSRMFF